MRRIILIILLILLSSCRTRYIDRTEIVKDTVMVDKILTITPASLNEIILEDICDSLGNLKPISYISTSDNSQTTVKTHQNTLKIKVNIDSIKQEAINTYKSTLKDTNHKEVVVKRYIPKWVWLLLTANILFIAYKLRRFII